MRLKSRLRLIFLIEQLMAIKLFNHLITLMFIDLNFQNRMPSLGWEAAPCSLWPLRGQAEGWPSLLTVMASHHSREQLGPGGTPTHPAQFTLPLPMFLPGPVPMFSSQGEQGCPGARLLPPCCPGGVGGHGHEGARLLLFWCPPDRICPLKSSRKLLPASGWMPTACSQS